MSEEIKNNQPVSDSELDSANGGFGLGNDLFTIEEYTAAGVFWKHHTLRQDWYYFNDVSITQRCAESITLFYIKNGRQCTQEEFEALKAKYN